MPSLLPYRPWKFRYGDASQISALTEPERRQDDRSPFVRYARSAALWAEWVREGVVGLDSEVQTPTVEISGTTFQLGVVPIYLLSPLVSVPPAAKDHRQRLLESTQLYVEPIIVIPSGPENFQVVGNHELFAAATAYQNELARPNKRKASDYCLAAVTDESFLPTIEVQPITFWVSETVEAIRERLKNVGYAVSPRADDPSSVSAEVDGEIFTKGTEYSEQWMHNLSQILGAKNLDQGSIGPNSNSRPGKTKVVLVSPKPRSSVQKTGMEFPYGSLVSTIKPFPGANMWSLRDFRVE